MRKGTLVLMFMLLLSSFALADGFVASGPVIPTGSWTQGFNESCSPACTFNQFQLFILTPGVTWGDVTYPTGLSGFSNASWTSSRINPQYAFASGNSTTNLNFNGTFSTNKNVPFVADFYALLNGNFVDGTKMVWSGSAWSYTPLTASSLTNENTAPPVPEPASMILIGTGLAGVIRRIRK